MNLRNRSRRLVSTLTASLCILSHDVSLINHAVYWTLHHLKISDIGQVKKKHNTKSAKQLTRQKKGSILLMSCKAMSDHHLSYGCCVAVSGPNYCMYVEIVATQGSDNKSAGKIAFNYNSTLANAFKCVFPFSIWHVEHHEVGNDIITTLNYHLLGSMNTFRSSTLIFIWALNYGLQ